MAKAKSTTKRKASVAAVATSIQKDLQETKPSVPLASAFPRQALGDSGTRILHGIITEEYNPQLQGIEGIKKFDEMRKNDGTVRAAMMACTLPIRRAQWFINPATDSQQDQDIRNYVEHALFDWMEDMTWDDLVRQALLCLTFGVMVFEKVYTIKNHDGKDWVTIKTLAPRLPKSIMSWELIDRTFGIQQIRQDGVIAQIPGSKLLIFINEKEGKNFWGTSMLRAAYKHWYYKDNFYKIDAIAFERQGIGIPHISMPQGYTDNDEKRAVQSMENLRGNEKAFVLTPAGYEVEFLNMGSNTTRDPETSINHHNKEILQSVLAQFLDLSSSKSGSGSKALSQDHSDLFLKAMEAVADLITSEINKNLIPEMVDMNFDNVKVYPVLDFSGIIKVDAAALATAYAALVTAGGITPTDDDQQYLRASMGLPPRSQEDIDKAAAEEPSEEEQEDHADIEDDDEPNPEGVVEEAAAQSKDSKPSAADNKKTDTAAQKKKPKVKKTAHEHRTLKRKFDNGKGFMSWRPLTFTEQKVKWDKIQTTIDEMESAFTVSAVELLNDAKDALMKKLHTAIVDEDAAAIKDISVGFVAKYTALLKDAIKKAYQEGKIGAAVEAGIETPANVADTMASIDLLATTIAEKTVAELEAKAKLASVGALKNDKTPLENAGEIDTMLQDAIDTAVDKTASVIVAQALNDGRNDVIARNPDSYYGIQRSEILDEKTCNFCLSMDGLVIEPTDEWASTSIFHDNCRGIWVGINKDEVDPPDITGVPDKIGDYFGGNVNELVQPPKPITREGTLADNYVKKRDAK